MLPKGDTIKGDFIFFEDSGYGDKNKSARSMYKPAMNERFAVLSVSTQLPFDFFLDKASLDEAHREIQTVFDTHQLPNKNIFFLGAGLTGHRALQYIKFIKRTDKEFQLNISGIVLCNFTLDWTRKWHQHQRDIRLNRIDLREPKFINYMLEIHLNGTPKTNPEAYHRFSPYSYSDSKNRNIKVYTSYAIRAYARPLIDYRLKNLLQNIIREQ